MKKILRLLGATLALAVSLPALLLLHPAAATTAASAAAALLYDFEAMSDEELAAVVSEPPQGENVKHGASVKTEIYTAESENDPYIGKGAKALKISTEQSEGNWPMPAFMLDLNPGLMMQSSSIVMRAKSSGDNAFGLLFVHFLLADGSIWAPTHIFKYRNNNWSNLQYESGNKGIYLHLNDEGLLRIPLDASNMDRVSGSGSYRKDQVVGLIIAGQSSVFSDQSALYLDEIYAVNQLERYYTDENVTEFTVTDPNASLLPPAIILNPAEQLDEHPEYAQYLDGNRNWQGVPSLARDDETGRLWACFFSSGITEGGAIYTMLYTSDDDGESWTGPKVVIDAVDTVCASDPNLWTDPDGRMWCIWQQAYDSSRFGVGGMNDGRSGVWQMYTDNPGDENPTWSEPVRVSNGYSLNDPIVLTQPAGDLEAGTWVRGVYLATNVAAKGCENILHPACMISRDKGLTWEYRGMSNITGMENIIAQKSDGTLVMGIRSGGVWTCESSDGGKTWTPAVSKRESISSVDSRFYLGRLDDNIMLAVFNNPPEGTNRTHMTAALSYDDGETWPDQLLLEEGYSTYPDVHLSKDGTIYIIMDLGRSRHGEIRMARITKEDIAAGELTNPDSKLHILINDNKYPADAATDVRVLYDFEDMTERELDHAILAPHAADPNVEKSVEIRYELYTGEEGDPFLGAGASALKLTAAKASNWPMAGFTLKLDGESLADASAIVLHAARDASTVSERGMLFDFVMADGSVFTVTNTPWLLDTTGSTQPIDNITQWNGSIWATINCGAPTGYQQGNYIKYSNSNDLGWFKIPLDEMKMVKIAGSAKTFDKTQIVGLVIAGQQDIIGSTNALYLDEVYAVINDGWSINFRTDGEAEDSSSEDSSSEDGSSEDGSSEDGSSEDGSSEDGSSEDSSSEDGSSEDSSSEDGSSEDSSSEITGSTSSGNTSTGSGSTSSGATDGNNPETGGPSLLSWMLGILTLAASFAALLFCKKRRATN